MNLIARTIVLAIAVINAIFGIVYDHEAKDEKDPSLSVLIIINMIGLLSVGILC